MSAKLRLEQLLSNLQPELQGLPVAQRVLVSGMVNTIRTIARSMSEDQVGELVHGLLAFSVRAAHQVTGDADAVVTTVREALEGHAGG